MQIDKSIASEIAKVQLELRKQASNPDPELVKQLGKLQNKYHYFEEIGDVDDEVLQ